MKPLSALWVGPHRSRLLSLQDFGEVTNEPRCVPPEYPGHDYGTVSEVIDGLIYVCELDGCRSYRPGSGGRWTKEPTMLMETPRRYAASTMAVLDDQTVWVVTGGWGKDNNIVRTTEIWSGGSWVTQETLAPPMAVWAHCIVSTTNGIMQIGGTTAAYGVTGRSFNGGKEISPMKKARHSHACTGPTSGYVIVAGGWGSNNKARSSVEMFHMDSETWHEVGNLPGVDYRGKLISVPELNYVIYVGGRSLAGIYKINGADLVAANAWGKVADLDTSSSGKRIAHIIMNC